jgi:methyl-accepting chemotaxis protein
MVRKNLIPSIAKRFGKRSGGRNGVRNRLYIFFLLVLVIPSLAVGITSYYLAKGSLEEKNAESAEHNTALLNDSISEYVTMEMQNIDLLSKQMASAEIDGKDQGLRELVDAFTSHHPELELVTLGSETGAWMKSPDPGPQDYDPRTRGWYKATMAKAGEVVVSDPYVSVTTGNVVVTVAKVLPDGKGVAGGNLSLAALASMTKEAHIGEHGYSFILDRNNVIVTHPTIASGEDMTESEWAKKMTDESGRLTANIEGIDKQLYYTINPVTGWKIVGTIDLNEMSAQSQTILQTMFVIILIYFVVGIIVVFFIIRSIIGPLKKVIAASEQISQGDLTQRIPVKRKDEIAQLSASFNNMADSLRDVLMEVGQTSAQLAASSEELTASSEQTSKATEHISVSIQEMAGGSEQQVQQVEESSGVVKGIAKDIGQIAASVRRVSDSAEHASSLSVEGNQAIDAAVRQMSSIDQTVNSLADEVRELSRRSEEIGQIVQVITDIARQTNLLALNAAIEASRAGENGRGFAVVAAEVRKLAEQSATSAKQISDLISTIQSRTGHVASIAEATKEEVGGGIAAVTGAGQSFRRILDSIEQVNGETREVNAASQQIADGTKQVVASIDRVSEIAKSSASDAQNISAASQQQLASMEEIAASAMSLTNMAEKLELLVQKFKV